MTTESFRPKDVMKNLTYPARLAVLLGEEVIHTLPDGSKVYIDPFIATKILPAWQILALKLARHLPSKIVSKLESRL